MTYCTYTNEPFFLTPLDNGVSSVLTEAVELSEGVPNAYSSGIYRIIAGEIFKIEFGYSPYTSEQKEKTT